MSDDCISREGALEALLGGFKTHYFVEPSDFVDVIRALPVVSSPVTLTRAHYFVRVDEDTADYRCKNCGAANDGTDEPNCPTLRECPTNHGRVEMLAHEDDFPPNGPCLMWSPICRDCGADVPMAASLNEGVGE